MPKFSGDMEVVGDTKSNILMYDRNKMAIKQLKQEENKSALKNCFCTNKKKLHAKKAIQPLKNFQQEKAITQQTLAVQTMQCQHNHKIIQLIKEILTL